MIDGISVAISTYNHLPYLKKCLYSIEKYSVLPKTEVSLLVDGCTDGTVEWLTEGGMFEITRFGEIHIRRENKGVFSGWNIAIKNCRNKYFFLGEDDLFFGPEWDYYLALWIEELHGQYVVMPQLVEPTPGSFPPVYDCGKSIESFDEQKFVTYITKIRKHELIYDAVGLWCMRKDLFFSIGGFDEFYDPLFHGGLDFQVRFYKAYPHMLWVRAWDSLIYHFPPGLHRKQSLPWTKEKYDRILARNTEHFVRKLGMNIEEAYKFLREMYNK